VVSGSTRRVLRRVALSALAVRPASFLCCSRVVASCCSAASAWRLCRFFANLPLGLSALGRLLLLPSGPSRRGGDELFTGPLGVAPPLLDLPPTVAAVVGAASCRGCSTLAGLSLPVSVGRWSCPVSSCSRIRRRGSGRLGGRSCRAREGATPRTASSVLASIPPPVVSLCTLISSSSTGSDCHTSCMSSASSSSSSLVVSLAISSKCPSGQW